MRVLLATDGSKDAATEWLKEFPLPGDTTVLIVTVAAPLHALAEVQMMRDLREAVLADVRRIGEEAQKILKPRWPGVEVQVREGDPREEIIRVAEEWGADLVVLGTRGLGAAQGFLLGSVSQTVARHATCPVLVVKGSPRKPGKVLVAMDGSEGSLDTLRFLRSLEPGRKLDLLLLGVVEPLRFPSTAPRFIRGPLKAALVDLQQERRAEIQNALGSAANEMKGKVGTISVSVRSGNPAEEIVRAAKDRGVDLIVVGARGLGGVKRLLLGSVSERVLRDARCPVLIVKRPARA